MVDYAESLPFPNNSRLREVVDYLYAVEMTASETSTFDGKVPAEWMRP